MAPGRGLRAQSLAEFGEMLYPDQAQEPILAKPVRDALTEWLTEIWASEDLKEVGLKPRQKALFVGPPGTGKTTLAHHLAARLKLPMVVVRSDRLIESWVGATDQNIGALFDLASNSEKVVLFIDEFDSLGMGRRKASQGADDARNSMVNTLLQRIESFDGFMIAATNRGEELDQAIWRRFDLQIALALPGPRERELILARYLAPFYLPAESLTEFAVAFAEASPALMRQFCEGLKRQFVVGPKVGWDMDMKATIGRLLAAVEPHPDLPRPRLWNRRGDDVALRDIPWPLPSEKKKPVPLQKAVA
jgi:MoxR-like ATPase